MWAKTVRVLALILTVGLLTVGCSSAASTNADTIAVSDTASGAPESDTAAPESTTTGDTDGGSADDGAASGRSQCTVAVTGDREDAWTFESGVNRVGIATDYWFSDEALREAVEELGGSYDEFVDKGEPLVSFLGI